MKFRPSLALLPVLLVSVLAASAQSTATLSGTVTDPSGAAVPGAHVSIHSLATGADRQIDTDSAGLYTAPSLQPGDYKVQATASGFSAYTVQKLNLSVDQRVVLDMKLAVASAGETVQVESLAPQIETQTMTVGQVIGRNTVQELPLNGRHFLDLTTLTPGGVVAPTAGSLTGSSRGLGANSFITAGNREDTVNFQINGINLNDMSQNQITFQPSINTTSEFKINNSTFSAEYGRSSGSIVNVATRSGTNQFHGEVFDYFRNDALDARNYFNRDFNVTTGLPLGITGKKAPLKRNNFGVALGGPIWRDHTFFFFSYEGLRQHQGILQNSTVLSAAQRAATVAAGKPAANALLAVIPVANSGNNYVSFTPGPVQIDQYTGDVSHHISASDQIHGFYAFQKDVRTEPNLQGDTIPGFGDHRNAHRQVLTINETHIFSPRLVNEGRLGFNRIGIAFIPNTPLNPNSFGIGDGVNANIGLPQITLSDIGLVFGGPSGFPQGRTDTLGVASDTATFLRGKHSVKFGGEFRRFLGASFAGDTGTLTYASTTSNFMQDTATGFSIQPTTLSSRIYVNAAAGFVQDNYKINEHLNIEAGLRFEWNGTPAEGANRFVVFNASNSTLQRVGTPGLPSVYKQNYTVEPRVGIVYDIFGSGRSVIRGGYALLADQPTTTNVSGLTTNPPFSTSVSYANAAAPIPVASLYNSARASGISLSDVNRNFRNSYTETYNLNIQQALPAGMVASIGYYGSVGRHLRVRTNENQPINGTTRPYTLLAASSPIAPLASIASNISQANSVSSSNYNAMWVTLSKTMSHGLEFNMNYQWTKSMDINSLGSQGVYVLQDSYNPGNNYGLSDFDVRQHYAGTAIYSLPFKRNRLVSGYQLSTIMQYQTGNPVNITAGNSTYTGVAGVVRPNIVGKPLTSKQQAPGLVNVNFIQNPTGTICNLTTSNSACTYQIVATQSSSGALTYTGIGNMQRNSVIGPGFADLDVSAEKDTKIAESLTFKLRVDAFDIFNHPNFGQPSGNVQSSTFGQISSTRFATSDGGSSRQLQISGKLIF
ncbi:MAG TPA: carboxypeptidase-like regulatory domain-containing protein [Acidobacteriaceae bacterium]|jgi:hypothetical protein|nr:carboxypeptidase-like regulatory domain-containing protein [Acidobacteriaceae bacterium]